jgi:hypothetical protein
MLIKPHDSVAIINNDSARIRKDSIRAQSHLVDGIDPDYVNKLIISRSDSSIWLKASMKLDHRIFGYEKPDVHSKKMILISIFTNEVEGNPFKCPWGAYYETSDMGNIELKYVRDIGSFVEANVIEDNELRDKVYFEKKWTEFVD